MKVIRSAGGFLLFSAMRINALRRLLLSLPRFLREALAEVLSCTFYHAQALNLQPDLDAAPALRAEIFSHFAAKHSVLQPDFSLYQGIAVLTCHPQPLPSTEQVHQWILRLPRKHRLRALAFLSKIGFKEFNKLAQLVRSAAWIPTWLLASHQALSSLPDSLESVPGDIDLILRRFNEMKRAGQHEKAHSLLKEAFCHESLSAPPSWLFEGNMSSPCELICRSYTRTHQVPKITIVMCAWNAEKYLPIAISSILAQTYNNIEIIAINDGSSDATQDILESHLANYPQARIVRENMNRGTYVCRNKGLILATGDYVIFHDADDWSHPEKIERQWLAIKGKRGALASSSNWFRINPETGECFARRIFPISRWNCSSFMFHRGAALERIGFYDSVRFGADSEYVARFEAAFGPHSHIRNRLPLSIGIEHEGSLTVAAYSGFDKQGLSQKRQSYTEIWRSWHAANVYKNAGLRLENGQRISAPILPAADEKF
jgi:hypothetical protein